MTKLKGWPNVPGGTAVSGSLLWDVPLQGGARGLSPKRLDFVGDEATKTYRVSAGGPELEFPHPRAAVNDNALRGPLVAVLNIGTGRGAQTVRYPLTPYETEPGYVDLTFDPEPAIVVAAQTLVDLINRVESARDEALAAAQGANQGSGNVSVGLAQMQQALADSAQSAAQAAAAAGLTAVQTLASIPGANGYYRILDGPEAGQVYQRAGGALTRRPELEALSSTSLGIMFNRLGTGDALQAAADLAAGSTLRLPPWDIAGGNLQLKAGTTVEGGNARFSGSLYVTAQPGVTIKDLVLNRTTSTDTFLPVGVFARNAPTLTLRGVHFAGTRLYVNNNQDAEVSGLVVDGALFDGDYAAFADGMSIHTEGVNDVLLCAIQFRAKNAFRILKVTSSTAYLKGVVGQAVTRRFQLLGFTADVTLQSGKQFMDLYAGVADYVIGNGSIRCLGNVLYLIEQKVDGLQGPQNNAQTRGKIHDLVIETSAERLINLGGAYGLSYEAGYQQVEVHDVAAQITHAAPVHGIQGRGFHYLGVRNVDLEVTGSPTYFQAVSGGSNRVAEFRNNSATKGSIHDDDNCQTSTGVVYAGRTERLTIDGRNRMRDARHKGAISIITLRRDPDSGLGARVVIEDNTLGYRSAPTDAQGVSVSPVAASVFIDSEAQIDRLDLRDNDASGYTAAPNLAAPLMPNTYPRYESGNSWNTLQTEGAGTPPKGYYGLGSDHRNTSAGRTTARGYVCTAAGWACNTAWAANTAYATGAEAYVGTRVYRASVAGNSAAVAPSHTAGTVGDGTVTWLYLGTRATFEAYGIPAGRLPTAPLFASGATGNLATSGVYTANVLADPRIVKTLNAGWVVTVDAHVTVTATGAAEHTSRLVVSPDGGATWTNIGERCTSAQVSATAHHNVGQYTVPATGSYTFGIALGNELAATDTVTAYSTRRSLRVTITEPT